MSTCSILGNSAPQSGSLHSSSRYLQNLEAGKADKELLWKVWGSVNLFFPTLKKSNYFTPSQTHPSPRQRLVHHCSHKPTWKTWRCQSLDGVINPQCQGKTALRAQVTSVHSPGKWLLSCQESALETLCSAGTTALAAAKVNKVPFCAPFIPANKYAGGGKALERQRASDSL